MRRAAGTGSQLGKSLLRHISSFLGGGKGVLDLPVLGQVQGSNLLSFLNLLLVGLDLALQLVNETLHALMVLPVLILLVGQFLDLALRLPHTLLCISHPPVLSIKLRFKLPDSGVHLAHGLLSSLEGVLLSIIKSGLKVLDLGFKKLAVTLKTHSTFLLATKLISLSLVFPLDHFFFLALPPPPSFFLGVFEGVLASFLGSFLAPMMEPS